jgi:hypothetical protein
MHYFLDTFKKIAMANVKQVTLITQEQLVRKEHPYRKILEIIDF